MTTRNLEALFRPRAIALIGASNQPGSVGQVVARNLLESGFEGPVMPVNPHAKAVRSALAYRRIADLPQTPDLAVVATPAATVPGVIAELGARGCRAAVVISTGFSPGASDPSLRQALLDAAKPHLLRIVGPNCLGFISPRLGINASFAHLTPKPGGLALVTQSGAIAAAALDWAQPRNVGFSQMISIGDAADVDVGDLLDYLALDPETRAILLYVESITDARKFMSAGRIAARSKPVVVIKAGRSNAGAKAAFSHTGALAGADAVYDAAFRRAGMLRVGGLRELFDAAATLSTGLTVSGDRLAILTNGGGAGVLAVDALDDRGGQLAELEPATIEAVSRAVSPNWSHRNPADILGDAPAAAYQAALQTLLADPNADAVLVMNCPTAVTDSTSAAKAVISAAAMPGRRKPVLTCWLGDAQVSEGRRLFAGAGLPTHETPDEAVRAFTHLVRYRRNQTLMLRTPSPAAEIPDKAAARAIVREALLDGRASLTDPEARAVLEAYGVPVVVSRSVESPQAAAEAARDMPGPLALKILSRDISHKSDVGGVALDISGPDAVAQAAADMLERVAQVRPDARLEGFVLEPMIVRPRAQELICGITQDATFGPVVLFGQGGVATEALKDRAVSLPPLDDLIAMEMIEQTRVAHLLAGFRDRPPADLQAIVRVLIGLGQLAADLPEVAELDINPLLADETGVLALDARIRIHQPGEGVIRPAILPYPDSLVRTVDVAGDPLRVRPIRPQDAPALVDMVSRSTPEDVRLRFLGGMRTLSPELAARLTQIDYDRQMALVAEDPSGEILGVARIIIDPEGETAEYAAMVRSDRQARGLGGMLLQSVLDYARARGLRQVWGEVHRENARMLDLADHLGFQRHPSDEFSVRVVKDLQAQPAAVAPAT
ncbi:bifunctional acetate--CoA ligase family protein/GNAT family N-acetyltransferase [Phenylobacterium deserti]|uniref:GNAT family N-acetyltransferase n=1 Tax=Phenylobacterium deserti TaxID=1914756 RepID=A0A328A965_9CAUL|nr:bifunctional acetate--CoA ligase family protein/GNAT family N-acetyltransferase [Phenylobacterium deserti]RAK51059.1 GNAT family N-acetyltransferase [Phenylobacterium deserti]